MANFWVKCRCIIFIDEVMEMVSAFEHLGTAKDAERLVISNRVALRLIKDEILRSEHFETAQEGVDDEMREFIDLPEVKFGHYSYPVRIMQ